MATLYHEVWINAPSGKIYSAISTAEGIGTWWDKQTPVQTPEGLVLEHNPGPEHGIVKLKVLDQIPDKRVEWECISAHPKTSPASAWTGTHITFEISRRLVPPWATQKTEMGIVSFRHSGWDEKSEFFGFCNTAWGEVLQKLKTACEAGK
jgi:hypothetical protein